MIHCEIKVSEGIFFDALEEDLFIEQMEAALGTVFSEELANVEVFFEEVESTGPINVNDTDMWIIVDKHEPLSDPLVRALTKPSVDDQRQMLREHILSIQESHTFKFEFRIWIRLLEGSFDQP